MTRRLRARTGLASAMAAGFRDPDRVKAGLDDEPLPDGLASWLARLRLLKGVPFSYLVPDEAMLPPESLRFFQVDERWVDSLVDGALSVGRPLSSNKTVHTAFETAMLDHVAAPVGRHMGAMRARLLGIEPSEAPDVISGFVLRSSLVTSYPGLSVTAYLSGQSPADKARDPSIEVVFLDLLRFETIGPNTLLCLIVGDVGRVDLHEAPEGLHYGIDRFEENDGAIDAEKMLHTFTRDGDAITIDAEPTPLSLDGCFRPSSRVMKMSAVGAKIAAANDLNAVDAAIMGFQMIEGVGMVSFSEETP